MGGAIIEKMQDGTGVAWAYFDIQIIFQLFFHFFLRRGGRHVGSIVDLNHAIATTSGESGLEVL